MTEEAKTMCDEILNETMNELSALRQKVSSLPDRAAVEAAVEAIDYFEETLPACERPHQMIENCGRAVADVEHEVAAAEHGYNSPEADAVFAAGEQKLNALLFALRQASMV